MKNTMSTLVLSTLISLCFSLNLKAQLPELEDDSEVHAIPSLAGEQDFVIPSNTSYNAITFQMRGGDGGFAKAGSACKSWGGDGATIDFTVIIGEGPNRIPAGTPIRFVLGDRGIDDTKGGTNFAIGGGGGGTGILAYINGSWEILAVAGGGGGAYQGNLLGACVDSQKGQGGRSGTSGGNGEGSFGGSGGTNGNGGNGGGSASFDYDLSGGGGGAFSDGTGRACLEGLKGFPEGASGGGVSGCIAIGVISWVDGGSGFGSGGAGEDGGGGGGGYSGGGGGGQINNGGGGGSYVNPTYAYAKTITAGGSSSPTEFGTTDYQFQDLCSGVINEVVFVRDLCHEGGRARIEVDYSSPQGNVCFSNLTVTMNPPNGQHDLGNGVFSFVSMGNYTISIVDETGFVHDSRNVAVEVETEAPDANCKNLTVQLQNGTYNNSNFHNLINDNSSDNCEIMDITSSYDSFDCSAQGEVLVVLTVTDRAGHSSECGALVTVENDPADIPVPSCKPAQTFPLTGNQLTITTEDIDNGSTLGACSGEIAISPTSFDCDDIGSQVVTLSIPDATGSTSCTSTITIVDTEAPTARCKSIFALDVFELDQNGSTSIAYQHIDNNSTDDCGGLTYSLSQNTLSCADVGELDITLTVSDASGNTSSCTTTISVDDSIIPTALCQDITIALDESGNQIISPEQIDDGSADVCNVQLTLSQIAFDCTEIGEVSVVLSVVDDHDNINTCSAVVTVEDNLPPKAICEDITLELISSPGIAFLQPAIVTGSSTDNCSNSTLPSILLRSNLFGCEDVGSQTITLEVRDAKNNTSTCTSRLTVEDNTAPTVDCPVDITLNTDPGSCSSTFVVPAPATDDNCEVSLLRHRYRPADEMGNNIPQTGWSSWSTNPRETLDIGHWKMQWQAKDPANNKVKCAFYVEVVDTQAPVPVCINPTVAFNGEASISLSMTDLWNEAASSDNCGDVFFIDQSLAQITCDQLGNTIPVTVTVEDTNGNTATCTAYVSVSGLPCNWEVDLAGLGCDPGEADFGAPDIFSLSTEACFDPSYYRQNDQQGFIQGELCSDGEIIARVTDVIGSGWAGIAMRESNDPSAPMIQLMIDGQMLTRREIRTSAGTPAFAHIFSTQGKNWLKLSRVGNQFSAYHSSDGVNWSTVFSTSLAMSNCIHVGLITMNNDTNSDVTGIFENVRINSSSQLAAPIAVDIAQENTTPMNVTVFPNPATDVINLQLEDFIGQKVQVQLYNQNGQSVLQQQWEEINYRTEQLNVSHLPAGMYILEVQSGNLQLTKRLVVAGM